MQDHEARTEDIGTVDTIDSRMEDRGNKRKFRIQKRGGRYCCSRSLSQHSRGTDNSFQQLFLVLVSISIASVSKRQKCLDERKARYSPEWAMWDAP